MATKNDRVKMIIAHYFDGNQARFAQAMGVTPQCVNSWLVRDLGSNVIDKICAQFPNISPLWMYNGDGEMFKEESGEKFSIPASPLPTYFQEQRTQRHAATREVSQEMINLMHRQLDILNKQVEIQQKNYETLLALFNTLSNK